MLAQSVPGSNNQGNQCTWIVFGASGLLGSNFVIEARKAANVWAAFCKHRVRFEHCRTIALDLRNAEEVIRLLESVRPTHVLNAAALTDVDYCELHPEEAREINAIAAENIAQAACRIGAKLVYVSTDSVFDGERGNYSEQDRTKPLNEYARSKLEGEQRTHAAHPEPLVVRTNMFGWGTGIKLSFSEWLSEGLEARRSLPIFNDVWFNPLLVNTLSKMILDLAEKPLRGVIHLATRKSCTKMEFAYKLADVFGFTSKHAFRPTPIEEVGLRARRPHDTSLDCQYAERLLGRPMPGLTEELFRLRHLAACGIRGELRSSCVTSGRKS